MTNDSHIIEINSVYHVGTMKPENLGLNSGSGSLEGRCLSVSQCPHAWTQIAKLGGNDLFELSKTGGRFLDVISVLNDPKLHTEITNWAISNGYAKRTTAFRVWTDDDESGEWSYFTVGTRKEAIHEININDDPSFNPDVDGPGGGPRIEPIDIVAGTEKLWIESGAKLPAAQDASDLIILVFAAKEGKPRFGVDLDGVWWNENFDPDRLSAPRGGIFPERIQDWKTSLCSFSDVEDFALSEDDTETPSP